jgi:hypothetical protein
MQWQQLQEEKLHIKKKKAKKIKIKCIYYKNYGTWGIKKPNKITN